MLAGYRTCFKVTQLHVSIESKRRETEPVYLLLCGHWPNTAMEGQVGRLVSQDRAAHHQRLKYPAPSGTCLLRYPAGKSMHRRTG